MKLQISYDLPQVAVTIIEGLGEAYTSFVADHC